MSRALAAFPVENMTEKFPVRPVHWLRSANFTSIGFGVVLLIMACLFFLYGGTNVLVKICVPVFALAFGALILGGVPSLAFIRYYLTDEGLLITRPYFSRTMYRYEEIALAKKVTAGQAVDIVADGIAKRSDSVSNMMHFSYIQLYLSNPSVIDMNNMLVTDPYVGDLVVLYIRKKETVAIAPIGGAEDEAYPILLEPLDPDSFLSAIARRMKGG